jgi:mono/diheme cytochrome c family protein
MLSFRVILSLVLVSFLPVRAARAQEADGRAVFNQACAACHADPGQGSRAPRLEALREQAAASVLDALTRGVMRTQAQRLNPSEIRAVAEFVTGKNLVLEVVDSSIGRCTARTPLSDIETTPHWNSWGADL